LTSRSRDSEVTLDTDEARAYPNLRHNSIAYAADYASFNLGMTFVSISSVLPALVGILTESAPLIGLVGTVWRGSWLLPQLPAGQWMNHRSRKKPFMLASALTSRLPFWILAAVLWMGLIRKPAVLLVLLFAGLGIFAAGDGVASMAWFDIMARVLPASSRSRVIGLAQVISGIAGIGAGILVSLILSSPSMSFPANYGLLFALASVFIGVSSLALTSIREPPATVAPAKEKFSTPAGWWRIIIGDRSLGYFIVCRILVGMVELSMPFYVGHAENVLHLPPTVIGAFVVAQTLGGIGASALLGVAGAHRGARYVIRVGSAIAALGPVLALLVHITHASWLIIAYPLIFVTLGVSNNVRFIGFFNYLLDLAPDDRRPTYVGLSNTILGLLTLAPTLGGWVLEATSYTVLFVATAALSFLGFLLTLGLKPTERVAARPSDV